jgi:hypothetical protein
MTRTYSGRAGQRRLVADLERVLTPRARRPSLPTAAWRWRYEIGLAAATAGAMTALLHVLGMEWGIIATSILFGVFGPPWPEPLAGWAWCVITQHRLRVGFRQARICTTRGKLPAILRTRRTESGERVLVRCPAGTSAEDIESARTALRVACWSADVTVTRDEQRSHRVWIDVIRRRPGEG